MRNPLAKVNVFRIVKDHVSTLKNYGASKVSTSDIVIFFILPLAASGCMVFVFDMELDSDLANLLITVFSIFAGLLFNLQVLMFDAIGKVSSTENLPSGINQKNSFRRRMILLESVSFNISFEVLLCLLGVLLLAISTLFKGSIASSIFSTASFYVVILFSLTLAMVLRRVHGMLSDEIQIQKEILRSKNKY